MLQLEKDQVTNQKSPLFYAGQCTVWTCFELLVTVPTKIWTFVAFPPEFPMVIAEGKSISMAAKMWGGWPQSFQVIQMFEWKLMFYHCSAKVNHLNHWSGFLKVIHQRHPTKQRLSRSVRLSIWRWHYGKLQICPNLVQSSNVAKISFVKSSL